MGKKKRGIRKPSESAMTPDACRRIREALNLTQEAFAEELGVKPLAVSRWENTVTPISKGRALAIRALAVQNGVAA